MDDERPTFGELVESYQKKVFQVALAMLGSKDEALDITQEVFIRAFRSYKDFRFNASPETWLIKITMNKVKEYFRREKLRRLLFLKPGAIPANQINLVADNTQSPQESVTGKQFKACVRAFQYGLKGREREVFALRFGSEYTIKEISELTGISQSSVKTHLYRALAKAQQHFSDWRNL